MSSSLIKDGGYQSLLEKISQTYATYQMRETQAMNVHVTETNWQSGHGPHDFASTPSLLG